MRDSFVFYKSFYDAIKELNVEQKCKIYDAIFDYQFNENENEIELSGIEKAIFTLIKPQLDATNSRYDASVENGRKGGAPKGNSNAKKQPKTTQKQPKNNLKQPNINLKQPKNNLNDNVNENVNVNENENENENENAKEKITTPPTLTEIQVYINANKLNVDAEKFYNYYKAINWRGVENWRQKLLKWSNTEKAENRNVKDANKYYDTVNPTQYKNLERFCCI